MTAVAGMVVMVMMVMMVTMFDISPQYYICTSPTPQYIGRSHAQGWYVDMYAHTYAVGFCATTSGERMSPARPHQIGLAEPLGSGARGT